MSKISRNAFLAPFLTFLNLVRILHHFTESCITNCKLCYHLRITSIFLAKNITSQSHSTSAWDFFYPGCVYNIQECRATLWAGISRCLLDFEAKEEANVNVTCCKNKYYTHLLCIQGGKGRRFRWNTVHYKSECFQYMK